MQDQQDKNESSSVYAINRPKGIYILPNLFTTANLAAGFLSIIHSMNEQFIYASVSIFVAMVLDSLDGRIARLTNTQSAFGEEYDSLSDMVAFGLAPALLSYSWSLFLFGNIGLMVSFVYAACAALRLARFNVQIHKVDKKWFVGLASPAAAGVIAGIIWAFTVNQFMPTSNLFIFIFSLIVFICGTLMVSNIKYYSFKDVNWRARMPFVVMVVMVIVVALFLSDPPVVLLAVFACYAVSGPAQLIYSIATRINKAHQSKQNIDT